MLLTLLWRIFLFIYLFGLTPFRLCEHFIFKKSSNCSSIINIRRQFLVVENWKKKRKKMYFNIIVIFVVITCAFSVQKTKWSGSKKNQLKFGLAILVMHSQKRRIIKISGDSIRTRVYKHTCNISLITCSAAQIEYTQARICFSLHSCYDPFLWHVRFISFSCKYFVVSKSIKIDKHRLHAIVTHAVYCNGYSLDTAGLSSLLNL